MKKFFIVVSLAIGILSIVLQIWIAYIYFYEPYYEDDSFNYSLHVFECTYKPTIK